MVSRICFRDSNEKTQFCESFRKIAMRITLLLNVKLKIQKFFLKKSEKYLIQMSETLFLEIFGNFVFLQFFKPLWWKILI